MCIRALCACASRPKVITYLLNVYSGGGERVSFVYQFERIIIDYRIVYSIINGTMYVHVCVHVRFTKTQQQANGMTNI